MKDFLILVGMALTLIFAPPAFADMTLVLREIPPACPGFDGCNFSEASLGGFPFGVYYDSLPVDEDLNVGPSEVFWQTQIDNVDGIHVDAQGDPDSDWDVFTDVTFTVDQIENYSISGSLDATGTTGALLDLHLFDVTNNVTVFRTLQESTGSTISLSSGGGGNVTDSIVGSNFGQLQTGVEYKYTVECSGAAASSIDCVTTNPVPEPGVASMFGCGILGLAGIARRRNRK